MTGFQRAFSVHGVLKRWTRWKLVWRKSHERQILKRSSVYAMTQMNTLKLLLANIVTCLDEGAIGTRVTNVRAFFDVAEAAIAAFDFEGQRVPGQGFLMCPELAPYLSAGVGKRSADPEHYVCRVHRGRVDAYLKRQFAAPCEGAALIVYTREAYLADPDVQKDEVEKARIEATEAIHVLVAVLGFAGPKAPLSPYRLAHNIAGGNNEALAWTVEEIVQQAKDSLSYDAEWSVVAD